MFRTVLVANRGEIACRVIRALSAMGIRSVAVYGDADRDAKHVRMADAAVRLGPTAPQESYLNIGALIEAAQATGAEAIHPGYGFVSENADFATACVNAGIVFIGPGTVALETMGDKIRAKKHVASHGVPVIPGTEGTGAANTGMANPGTAGPGRTNTALTDDELIRAAPDVGFPLLIKPSAGGGGKGMRVVDAAAGLPEALAAARRVATSAFGDDTLLLEHLVEAPRHIEVQILADAHGSVIHLGERECSLQRRHQKVIEEAPSVLLDVDTRARIGEAACEVARSVEYSGAGTVEFLVSAHAPSEFYFMEMNTRLQVEHPVTELVTGVDLVEWQIRIAAGEPLTIAQDDVVLDGHAVEARVYAEDPAHGFLPATGRVLMLEEPSSEFVRVDSCLVGGLEITPAYDPLLSKVIAWGAERMDALARLDQALAATIVLGVQTNIEFLRLLIDDSAVRSGDIDTGLIERLLPELELGRTDDAVVAGAALSLHARRWGASDDLWQKPSGWRMGADPRPTRYNLVPNGANPVNLEISGSPDQATIQIVNGTSASTVRSASLQAEAGSDKLSVELDGIVYAMHVAQDGDALWIACDQSTRELTVCSRERQIADQLGRISRADDAFEPELRSPMPGTVVAVGAVTGDTVEPGQTLVTVEAMKMEHPIAASVAGIARIDVTTGDVVVLGQVVAHIGSKSEAGTTEAATSEEGASA